MTIALKKILTRLNKLPSHEQYEIAILLSQELDSRGSFAKSQKALGSLAKEALVEYKIGKTKPMRFK